MIKLTPKIEVLDNGCIQVREVRDGVYHRRVIAPLDNIKNESQTIKDLTKEVWTPEVIKIYTDQVKQFTIL